MCPALCPNTDFGGTTLTSECCILTVREEGKRHLVAEEGFELHTLTNIPTTFFSRNQ